jgi:hypothetical protein
MIADRLEDWGIGYGHLPHRRPSRQDYEAALLGEPDRLQGKAGLADSGFAGQADHRPRTAERLAERSSDFAELCSAPDQFHGFP